MVITLHHTGAIPLDKETSSDRCFILFGATQLGNLKVMS